MRGCQEEGFIFPIRLARYVVAVVSVFHFEPTFAGPTKDTLGSPEIEPLAAGVVEACLVEFARSRPEEARELVDWVVEDARWRRAERASRRGRKPRPV